MKTKLDAIRDNYDSTPEEVMEEMDRDLEIMLEAQKNCPHSHKMEDLDPEDGCLHCGFYAK